MKQADLTMERKLNKELGLEEMLDLHPRMTISVICSKCDQTIDGRIHQTINAVCHNCRTRRMNEYARSGYQQLKGSKK